MALQMRRVITGHDAAGRAIVKIDDIVENPFEGRPGATVYPVWSSEGFPISNDGQDDEGLRKTGTTLPNGTIFRILEFALALLPGTTGPTQSTMGPFCRAKSIWNLTGQRFT
jgi:hypothetical protein